MVSSKNHRTLGGFVLSGMAYDLVGSSRSGLEAGPNFLSKGFTGN